ncbi:MAG: squalene/phytoene synthase family protein [Caldilinea sp.]|uniref:phytoene/squalene synthase family protein n=1 Tax=Caldilinea sp. TaxID=2293560 RepID=UPI002CF93FCF|nr:squalene/phytoene synthase family protein [Caldilinea sp.]
MQLQHAWERTLLDLAHEALHGDLPAGETRFEQTLLEQSYRHCESITAVHSRSFHLASRLLPAEKRRAARALYAFCRVSDDIVDHGQSDAQERLANWRRRATSAHPPLDDLVAIAWADARVRFNVPIRYAEQLIDGVARDFQSVRYDTFEELAAYCYGVASTVGLMSMHIIGFSGQDAIPYAIKLGVALQMTNILRDVGEDWRAGRLYLPREELDHFAVTDEMLTARVVTEQWRSFMRFQIERNRRLYDETMPGIAMLNRDGRFAIGASADFYRGILDEIERNDYDNFSKRAFVATPRKMRMLPGIWWRSR